MATEEVRPLTEEAVRERAVELGLAGKGLTGPPLQIGQLSQLQILPMYNIQLTVLPPHTAGEREGPQVTSSPALASASGPT